MKPRFLGTSAGELYPGIWCRCVRCESAGRILDSDLLREGGAILASHFSPHHCPNHDEADALLRPHGIAAAYDGMEWASQPASASATRPANSLS